MADSPESPTVLLPIAKPFDDGDYLIFRRLPKEHLSKKAGGGKLPHYRHKTRESAEAEAKRLLKLFPESTFIVMREIATVKMRPVEALAVVQAARPNPNQRGDHGYEWFRG